MITFYDTNSLISYNCIIIFHVSLNPLYVYESSELINVKCRTLFNFVIWACFIFSGISSDNGGALTFDNIYFTDIYACF